MAARVAFAGRRQLGDEVAGFLRESILAGDLAPGIAVKAEAIGEELGVSATPVREALQSLRVEGFLDLVPRRGFTVAKLLANDIRDIFEAYALIAGELACRAAVRMSDEELAELGQIHTELLDAAEREDQQQFERLNGEFHDLLYALAGSERLRWALEGFVKYVPSTFFAELAGWFETSVAQHTAVMSALVARDADAARTALSDHIRTAGARLAETFEAREQA